MINKIFFGQFLVLAVLFNGGSSYADSCGAGLNAFSQTVYAKVRRDCVRCHGGSRPEVPAFATSDMNGSYEHLLRYMNFTKIEDSLLVVRAGNGHCRDEACEGESGEEMKKLAQDWWNGGENQCFRNGKFFTAEISIPNDLPDETTGFKTVSFDLATISNEFRGLTLLIDIQNYLKIADSDKYKAYRFKSPRLVSTSAMGVSLKDIKILLNGKYDPVYNAYTTIDADVKLFASNGNPKWSSVVLSAQSMIILKDSLDTEHLSVSFSALNTKNVSSICQKLAGYTQNVKTVAVQLKCSECHNSQAKEYGSMLLNFDMNDQAQCEVATSLLDANNFRESPLVKIPIQNFGKHPQLNDTDRMIYVKALKTWLQI